MTAQISPSLLRCYRIGDPQGRYPIFDAAGSQINPGRWNTPASRLIYTSERYSTAVLEKLVHGNGVMPPNQHYIEITIPHGVTFEVANTNDPRLRGWDDATPSCSKVFGDDWYNARRSLLLIVPSVLARLDQNVLINPDHPEFFQIRTHGSVGWHQPVTWDARFFGQP